MYMATIEELKQKAVKIKTETEVGGNTAERVGQILEDIVDKMGDKNAGSTYNLATSGVKYASVLNAANAVPVSDRMLGMHLIYLDAAGVTQEVVYKGSTVGTAWSTDAGNWKKEGDDVDSSLNYVKSVEDIEVEWTSGAYIDKSNNVVSFSIACYVKNLNIAGYDAIETNAGWWGSARALILDAGGVVLKNVTYGGESSTNRYNKIISLKDYPTAAMVSISSGHNSGLYVRGVKITDKTIQDYLNEYDLTKIASLESELKPITIYSRGNGFYNNSPIWMSATGRFSVKSTDPVNLLAVKEGMTFHYAGNGTGNAVNYAFYNANKELISSVDGQNLLAGIDVTVPAGAKYAFFQSFSVSSDPETVSFTLTTNDLFRQYIEGLIDVKALNMLKASNILWGKKYVAIGDSFTDVIGTEKITEDGPYKGSSKVYPYIIGNRNNMGVLNQGASGSILGGYIVAKKYEKIPKDVDYITIWYGINDSGHGIAMGTADDTVETWSTEKDGSTGAAFNWIFNWIFTNRPYVHIGVIVTDYATQDRREVIMECCRRWGVAYLDLYDPTIPMIRTRGSKIAVNDTIKNLRNKYFSIDGAGNIHPSNNAHQWQANIVEHFMRGL